MLIRIHATELMRFAENELPWWADGPRAVLGKVTSGVPAQELDENEEPTGWLLMSHPGIDLWDLWLLDVVRAGWAYADSREDGEELIEFQALVDWGAWEALQLEIELGQTTRAEALERCRTEAIAQAALLGVEPPAIETDPSIDILEE